jgi:hypothetical protein
MGAIKKQDTLTKTANGLMALCLVLDLSLLVVALYSPEFAGYDLISPRAMVFLPSTLSVVFVVLGLFGILVFFARARAKALAMLVFVASTSAMLIVNHAGLFKNGNERFLTAFSNRIKSRVGTDSLNRLFMSLRSDVESGNRVGSKVHYRDLPNELKTLYSSTPPSGNLAFESNKVYALWITWGGPFFRWGVEVWPSGEREMPRMSSLIASGISTNIETFISK